MNNDNNNTKAKVAAWRKEAKFAEPHPMRDSWEDFGGNAEAERHIMAVQFNAWVIKTRFDTERRLLNLERFILEVAPFAQAGIDGAASPKDVPLVVFEFATTALDIIELKRKLRLLNTYYRQAANTECESLSMELENQAEINDLWQCFMADRTEE